jgi:hypothetical protein
MSLVFWGKVYLDLQKHRIPLRDRWIDLAIDLFMAILFSIAFIDMFMSINTAIKLINMIKNIPR